jgi:acyl carrier protein phosphodiesterase
LTAIAKNYRRNNINLVQTSFSQRRQRSQPSTDRHRQVAQSRRRLRQRHRHYSAVIVDIFYDDFLARNWQEYSAIPLADFARHACGATQRFGAFLTPQAKQTLPRMIANNWLVNYGKLEGIDRALQGMAGRAAFPSSMAGAMGDLQEDYLNFEHDFRKFFPELVTHSKTCQQALADSDSD